jgi:hypothetical protein
MHIIDHQAGPNPMVLQVSLQSHVKGEECIVDALIMPKVALVFQMFLDYYGMKRY